MYPLSSCREFWVFRDPPLSLGLSWRDRAALPRATFMRLTRRAAIRAIPPPQPLVYPLYTPCIPPVYPL
jgi:hypothetical protein